MDINLFDVMKLKIYWKKNREVLFSYLGIGAGMMTSETWYPTENEVIDTVVLKLKSLSFKIISICNTKERGIDIVSEKQQYTLLIEAKGGTSSMEESNNYGKPFDRNQARTHISVAIFTAMSLISKYKGSDKVIIGIALPYDKNHREFIEKLKYAFNKLEIVLFWVKYKEVLIEVANDTIGKMFEDDSLEYNHKGMLGCPKCGKYNEVEVWDKHTKQVEGYPDENFSSAGSPMKKHIEQELTFRCPMCNEEVFGIDLLRKNTKEIRD